MKGKQFRWDGSKANPIADILLWDKDRFHTPMPEADQLREDAKAFEEVNGEPPNTIVLPAKTRKTRRDRWMKEVKRSGKSSSN